MIINNYVLIRRENANIGYFKKSIEMPCVPPIGTKIWFNKAIGSLSFIVETITYSEESGEFSLHFELDVSEEEVRTEQPLNDSHFPKRLIKLGFEVEWLEEGYEDLITT
ncbi:hypothetical protein L4C38_21140 [Vibrio kasasachensis]|uniref:hypothetical protein n=1 Tax=Vibrio kasasachensis TaxID=2910248 RepID=UPI003D115583